jgi:hypothetical protein
VCRPHPFVVDGKLLAGWLAGPFSDRAANLTLRTYVGEAERKKERKKGEVES